MQSDLYAAIEKVLRAAKAPMTCNELFDVAEVRESAESASRVSDYLGNLFRRGAVERLPAPKGNNDAARWAYQWRKKQKFETTPNAVATSSILASKPGLEIHEKGKTIIIDLPSFRITIDAK